MSLSPALLQKLDAALIARRVSDGFRLLEQASDVIDEIVPEEPLAVSFLLNIAQWIDMGYRDHHLLKVLLSRFSGVSRINMTVGDFIRLRIAEAFSLFASEDAPGAISILTSVLAIQSELSEPYLILVAHFWKGRAHRQKGEYELAMHHMLEAKVRAVELRASKLIAVIQIHESWLLFQRGQRKEAFRLLDEAESALKLTGHDLALGNIQSARGRYVRRSGEYAAALEFFNRAIGIYSKRFPQHPNLARVLVNTAYVKRLIAFDLRRKKREGRVRGTQHDRALKICREALDLLEQAREIYALHRHQTGTGSVLVNAGYVHLEIDDIEHAAEEAAKAYQLGNEKRDWILMARARILQAAVENAEAEEQVGEADDVANHANLAVQYADEAIEFAKLTQNKRLLAGAYIARGSTAANVFFEDWDLARKLAESASELLSTEDRDHLSKELLILKSRILRATGIDQTLRSWSDGVTGEKSFQQVSEEFAELVIPKVWLREGRNISRVALKLSISPKKVRRILRKVHLLQS